MAKKAKVKKRKRRASSYMMVIRVRVPGHRVPGMRVHGVVGQDDRGWLYHLQVLNAYYDTEGQPNAMPGC